MSDWRRKRGTDWSVQVKISIGLRSGDIIQWDFFLIAKPVLEVIWLLSINDYTASILKQSRTWNDGRDICSLNFAFDQCGVLSYKKYIRMETIFITSYMEIAAENYII